MPSPDRTDRPASQRCVTPDGLGIAVYDFGGAGPDLLLAHATGFCAEPFTPLVRGLTGSFHCFGLDLRAHGRSDRPADGNFSWDAMAVDLLAVVDHLGLVDPCAFGHSCGGAVILLAEEARPGTFRSLYGFEPVVMPDTARALMAENNPLAAGARRRRSTFPSAEEALANFSSKPPFAELDPEALHLYVEAGFEPVPAGEGGDGLAVRLRCRREDEADVFEQALFHEAFGRLDTITCPVTLGYGALTDAFGPNLMAADAARIRRGRTEALPGVGHFGPLQRPDLVAASVLAAFHR